jgi:uncharacterized protein YjbI with pentapeptide repeats
VSKAFVHRGFAIEFDDEAPRLSVDGEPLPLPADIENAIPEGRARIDVSALIERARRHIDEAALLNPRDPIRDEHERELKQGVPHWNEWRRRNPAVRPLLYDVQLSGRDLSGANLANANLIGAHLEHATLIGTNFHEANLATANLSHAIVKKANFCRTDLYETILCHANLEGANLQGTQLVRSDFRAANLVGCRIYGFSAWDLILDKDTVQKELVIIHQTDIEPTATTSEASERVRIFVDDLRVAQFVYLMLHNENLRSVLDVMTRRAVLILGRFTDGRKKVLDDIRKRFGGTRMATSRCSSISRNSRSAGWPKRSACWRVYVAS